MMASLLKGLVLSAALSNPVTGTVVAVNQELHYAMCEQRGITLVTFDAEPTTFAILCRSDLSVGDVITFQTEETNL